MPFVTVKIAQTLDGRIATSTGQSKWISSDESLRLAHELRRDHQAVMVGIGTVLADDPLLTVRLVEGRNPLRIVVDSKLRIPVTAQVLSDGSASETLVATTELADSTRANQITRLGAEVLRLPCSAARKAGSDRTPPDERVDLVALLAEMDRRGILSVLVEGGASLITSLLSGRLVDRLVAVIAPKIIGSGTEWAADLGIRELGDAITFSSFETRRSGDDLVFDGLPRKDQ